MATRPQPPARLAFGPFIVDGLSGELRRSGIPLRLSGQPFQILMSLLTRPGEVVTREQLRAEIWPDGTFVDFEHGLNAAVNKLRRALGDSADNPRYIETVPGRGYRFIGILERPLPKPVPLPIVSAADLPVKLDATRLWWIATTAACVALAFFVGWRLHGSGSPLPDWKLTQLTTDPGLSEAPALSSDSKLLAYSSDRAREGAQDLYIRQIAGGQPIRLTFDGAGNTAPNFSPDGSKIVFRSNRDGGGVYEIPALGGESRLLARDGLDPKFSPDGSQVAYWVGAVNVAFAVPGSGSVWVIPAAGGQPRQVGTNLTAARYPIWSPDGRKLLFVGYKSTNAYEEKSSDWWLASAHGGDAVKTGAYEAFARSGLEARDSKITLPLLAIQRPCCWLSAGGRVIFSASTGDTRNLWETKVSPLTGRVNGSFTRLTTGAGTDVDPACAGGDRFVFTNVEARRNVWSLPIDLDRSVQKGPLERITQFPARREHASLSANGSYVAFASNQSSRFNVWRRDLATGKELHVIGSSIAQRFPLVNASGSRIAFSSYEGDKRVLYVTSLDGRSEKLCDGCLRATDWSRDDKTLLVFVNSPYEIDALDIASHRRITLLKHPSYNLLYARFSPDNRWVSFTARFQPNRAWIMVAPVNGAKPVSESAWIKVAEESAEDWANWSPDGKTLYFTSGRDRHFCLWGQHIDPHSHKPVGEAFAVQHIHGRASYQQGGWSAGGGRIAMVLREDTGNIWMMSRSGDK